MKKIMVLAVAALFAVSLFTGCNGLADGDDYTSTGATDTVLTLDAPSVSGKAYYGFNHIWWDTVASAKTYALYRDGAYIKSVTAEQNTTATLNYYNDFAVEDGISYKYEVIAIGANTSSGTPTRAIYLKSSKGTVSVTGNVPTPTEFENAVKSSLSVGSDGVSSKIVFEEAADGFIGITFPAKAWLTYTVYSVEQGLVTDFSDALTITNVKDASTTTSLELAALRQESYDAHVTLPPSAGTKEIYVVATSRASSNKLANYDSVSALSKTNVTIAKIDEKAASSNVTAVWTDEDGLKARIYWTPATTSTGDADATTNFVVYRKAAVTTTTPTSSTAYDYTLTKLDATVTVGNGGVYFIDDTLTSAAFATTYYIVHTDGTRYGQVATGSLSALSTNYAPAATLAATVTTLDNDGKANDIVIAVTVDNDETLTLSYTSADTSAAALALAATEEGTELTLPAAYQLVSSTTSSDKLAKKYTVVVKDLDDAYYALRAATALDGYETSYAYGTRQVNITASATDAPALTVAVSDYDGVDTDTTSNDFLITATTGNLNQTLTLLYGYDENSATVAAYNALNAPTAIELPATGIDSTTTVTYTLIKEDQADGYYYFLLVASEDGYVPSSTSATKTINTVATTATPSVSAAKGDYDGVDTDDALNDLYITVTSGNLTQTLKLYYASAATSAEAVAQVKANPIEWTLPTACIVNEDAETKTYQFAKTDLADAYYALRVVATEDGYASAASTIPTYQINTEATVATTDPSLSVTFIDTSDKTAGMYFSVGGTVDQSFTLVYGFSTISAADAQYVAKSAPTPITLPTTKTTNGTAVLYGWSDTTTFAAEGYYYFILTASEADKVDATATSSKQVSTAETTASSLTAPTISALNFTILDNDGKYNDIDDFTVTVSDTNSTLSAVRYAVGLTLAQAQTAVLSGETSVTLTTPAQSSADPDAATYTYTFSEAIKDIAEDNYVAVIAVVTDKDTTDEDEYTDNYYIVTSGRSYVVGNTVVNVDLDVSQYVKTTTDGKSNDFMFNVGDYVLEGDKIGNYTYELQYAVYDPDELSYTTSWTKLADLTMERGSNTVQTSAENYYVATYSQDDLADGYYEFRVVKTSAIDTSDTTHELYAATSTTYIVSTTTSSSTTELTGLYIQDGGITSSTQYIVVYTNGTATSTLTGATYTVYRATSSVAAGDLISVNYAATDLAVAVDATLAQAVVKDTTVADTSLHYYYYVKAVYGDTTLYSNIIQVEP